MSLFPIRNLRKRRVGISLDVKSGTDPLVVSASILSAFLGSRQGPTIQLTKDSIFDF